MLTMHYPITLASDYDMNIIRERTINNGCKTDGFQDLMMKAYLISEKDKFSNFENRYAPFYLWENEAGMNHFIFDGFFENIQKSFGWTNILYWVVMDKYLSDMNVAKYAMVKRTKITEFSNLSNYKQENLAQFELFKAESDCCAQILSYNPYTWEFCAFTLSKTVDLLKKISTQDLIYEVLHVSLP